MKNMLESQPERLEKGLDNIWKHHILYLTTKPQQATQFQW